MHLPNRLPGSRLKNLVRWIARPFDFMDEASAVYGDTFTAHFFGFQPLVFLSHPQAIKEIFAIDGRAFDAGRGQEIFRPLLGDHSLLVLDGDRHKRDRKLLMPPFHGTKVNAYGDTICQITQDICMSWKPNQTILAAEVMPEITLEVMLQTVFGLREGDRYQQLKLLLVGLIDLIGSPLSSSLIFFKGLQKDLGRWSPWGKVVRQRRQIYRLLQAELEDRRKQDMVGDNSRNDILSLMMSAKDEAGQPMTDIELKDELMTLLVAGHETTASALSWAIYWVHKLPKVKSKLMAELESVENKDDPMAFAKLPYLTAVASETLRMYPVAPIASPRISDKPVTIKGQTFPPETFLTPAIYIVHHREDLYPEAKVFRPERFLERTFSSSEFLPFGGGNRRCIGYALARLEINLVLATILTHRPLQLANDQPVTPRRHSVVIATSNGVPLRVMA